MESFGYWAICGHCAVVDTCTPLDWIRIENVLRIRCVVMRLDTKTKHLLELDQTMSITESRPRFRSRLQQFRTNCWERLKIKIIENKSDHRSWHMPLSLLSHNFQEHDHVLLIA